MAAETGSFTTLDDWLAWLETLSPREIVLGLERVAAVLDRLTLPRAARVINVAGTNGKGSSVAMLEALFAGAGYKTASYTSPHVLHYNERIRVDRSVGVFRRDIRTPARTRLNPCPFAERAGRRARVRHPGPA